MRRLVIVAVLVVVIAVGYRGFGSETTGTGTLTVNQPWPTPGETAPNFEASGLNGQEFEMPDEGTYVVSFWSGLNQGSHTAHPAFEQLARDYGSEVPFAAIYVGGVPRQDRLEPPYTIIQDSSGELTSVYNVKRVPRIFLIEDGTVRLTQESFYDEDEREMRRELEATLQAGNETGSLTGGAPPA